MLQHAHGCGFLIKKCDVKGGEGGGQKVNVIVTLRSAKVVWKCPLIHSIEMVLANLLLRLWKDHTAQHSGWTDQEDLWDNHTQWSQADQEEQTKDQLRTAS